MAPPRTRRRSPGEGSVWPYATKAGEQRYAIGYMLEAPDGTRRSVTRRRGSHGEKWTTRKEAATALREILAGVDRGAHVDPSRQALAAYLGEWLDGLRLRPGTVASYRRNLQLHVIPVLGAVPLSSLTGARISALWRQLERTGRKDLREGTRGLSPRTVRYVHTVLSAALRDAVKERRLARNPADDAKPPTAREAKAPEMRCWTAGQLAAFLGWSAEGSWYHPLWVVLASTGMRRGEALALRWRDVSLDSGTVSVRRSAGVVRDRRGPARLIEGDTKSGKPRVVDRFKLDTARCNRETVADLPPIRLHALRHTHATALLEAKVPVHVVSQRLGHASPVITMSVYAHVLPGSGREAADLFASLIAEARPS